MKDFKLDYLSGYQHPLTKKRKDFFFPSWKNFVGHHQEKNICGLASGFRACTVNLKIKPVDFFLEFL